MTSYGDKSYWDKRYEAQDDLYDWYMSYSQFKAQIIPKLNVKDPDDEKEDADKRERSALKVLVVGCGNSELSEQLHDDGFTDLESMDYSETVIDKMKSQTSKKELKFEVMDVRDMKYEDEQFDVIVDKGTLDSLLCGADSSKNASLMLSECQRCLKKGGFFFVITYGQPQSRLNYLEKSKYKWKVTHESLGKTRFMYTMENA